jgi:hypothetical protein
MLEMHSTKASLFFVITTLLSVKCAGPDVACLTLNAYIIHLNSTMAVPMW